MVTWSWFDLIFITSYTFPLGKGWGILQLVVDLLESPSQGMICVKLILANWLWENKLKNVIINSRTNRQATGNICSEKFT